MSYELEHVTHMSPCPCGKSHVVYGWGTNDWGRIRKNMHEIWCPECKEKYKFLSRNVMIPKDYPEYIGNPALKIQLDNMRDHIHNYESHISAQTLKDRDEECIAVLRQHNLSFAADLHTQQIESRLRFCKQLVQQHSKAELLTAMDEMLHTSNAKFLSGCAYTIAHRYKSRYRTTAMKTLRLFMSQLVILYNTIFAHISQDELEKKNLQERYNSLLEEYNDALPEYLQMRKQHEFHWIWKPN